MELSSSFFLLPMDWVDSGKLFDLLILFDSNMYEARAFKFRKMFTDMRPMTRPAYPSLPHFPKENSSLSNQAA